MKLKDVAAAVEGILPLAWCEEWDNSGLLVGDPNAEVQRIAVALDASPAAVAAASGCDLLLVHHPVIFKPLRNLLETNPPARAITFALKNNIAIYAAHTNWDVAPNGVNKVLADLLSLCDIEPLVPSVHPGAWGMGAVGRLDSTMDIADLSELLKERWGLSWLRVHGGAETEIARVALMGGSGGAFWQAARDRADVYITADAGYHNILDSQSDFFPMISVEHGEMERASIPILATVIEDATKLHVAVL